MLSLSLSFFMKVSYFVTKCATEFVAFDFSLINSFLRIVVFTLCCMHVASIAEVRKVKKKSMYEIFAVVGYCFYSIASIYVLEYCVLMCLIYILACCVKSV